MRRMITGKQQEFVEKMGETVKVIQQGQTPGIQIGSEDSGVKVYGDASYKSVDLLTTDDAERFGIGYDGLTYNMFLGDNTIENGFTIADNMLTFYSNGGQGYIQFLGNSFYGDEKGLVISNNYGETASIELTPEGDITMLKDGNIIMNDLPTSDPHVENALWNDNGTLKISAGGN